MAFVTSFGTPFDVRHTCCVFVSGRIIHPEVYCTLQPFRQKAELNMVGTNAHFFFKISTWTAKKHSNHTAFLNRPFMNHDDMVKHRALKTAKRSAPDYLV